MKDSVSGFESECHEAETKVIGDTTLEEDGDEETRGLTLTNFLGLTKPKISSLRGLNSRSRPVVTYPVVAHLMPWCN